MPGIGGLPAQAATSTLNDSECPFSVCLHVPYCRACCGYCGFNTCMNLIMG